VILDGERFDIRSQVYTMGGYSAHADRVDLIRCSGKVGPGRIKLLHGDPDARTGLEAALRTSLPGISLEAAYCRRTVINFIKIMKNFGKALIFFLKRRNNRTYIILPVPALISYVAISISLS
jgi:hypothetical protein